MSVFPLLKTGAVAQYPAQRSINRSTQVLRFVDGSEQRWRESAGALLSWEIRLDLLDEDEMTALREFVLSLQGQFGTFSFTDPWSGTVYPSCSLSDDETEFTFEDEGRGKTTLTVNQNRT